MEGLAQLHDFDPPGSYPLHNDSRLQQEQAALHDLVSEDYYWDLNSPECVKHRLGSQSIPPTSPAVTPYCPKNTFKELPSRHITEDIDPWAMVEQVSVDVTEYIQFQAKKFEYDPLSSEIVYRTDMNREADEVVTDVIEYLGKVSGQSLARYREFGLTVPTESLFQQSAVKGKLRLYEFAYFQQPLREFPVDLDFLPVWEHVLTNNPTPSNAPITLRIRIDKVELARHISPTFTVQSEILLNVDLRVHIEDIIVHCLRELEGVTQGMVHSAMLPRLGLVLDDVLFANSVEIREIPIISNEREQGENTAKLVLIQDNAQHFKPSQPLRKWKATKATLRIDVSAAYQLATSPLIHSSPAPSSHPFIRTLDVQVATVTVTTSLLSPPSWLLQEVVSIVKLAYGVDIFPINDDEELVLKGSEGEQYLTDDHQLQYYDLIRDIVAEDQPIKLKLVSRRLKYEHPALNFYYEGQAPAQEDEEIEPKADLEEQSDAFTFTVKKLSHFQALFKHLDRSLPEDIRSSGAKGCFGLSSKKVTPRYISPKAVSKSRFVPDIDMSREEPEAFRAHAEQLLAAGGVALKLAPAISLRAKLLLGDEELRVSEDNAKLRLANNISVMSQFQFQGLPLRNFPCEIRLGIEVVCAGEVLACVTFALFEARNGQEVPRFGEFTLRLWPLHCICPDYVTMLEFAAIPSFTGTDRYATITFEIPKCDYQSLHKNADTYQKLPFGLFQLNQLADLLDLSPIQMEESKKESRELIYNFRHLYKMQNIKLVYFLNNVMWTNSAARDEAAALISQWTTISAEDAVCLLSCQFFDTRIRAFVVTLLEKMENQDLANYIPQLAQALFFELRHNSDLENFLIKRALADPYEVGHQFFWCLQSQFSILPYRERLKLVIERFAMRCGNYRTVLATEVQVMQILKTEAALSRSEGRRDPIGFTRRLKERLLEKLPAEFMIPTSSTRILLKEGLECEVMDSKLKPVRFVFQVKGCQGKVYQTMLKVGDDLRQDMLILQLFRIMQKIWRDARLPVRLKTYRVVAIDRRSGMIEMVPNSSQISKIHVQHGVVASRSTWIHDYLLANNADYQSLKRAQTNFMISCACYCAATYVLGIGDRHDGNIMVDKNGVLFHIDFGHILGNFKRKWLIRREHYKVKYSEDMDTVLDIANSYEDFLALTQQHYNAIRAKGHRLFYLMKMMSTGAMPELKGFEDLKYLIKRLKLEKSDRQVKDVLRVNVEKSKKSVMRRIDRCAHNFRHFFKTCTCTCLSTSDSS